MITPVAVGCNPMLCRRMAGSECRRDDCAQVGV